MLKKWIKISIWIFLILLILLVALIHAGNYYMQSSQSKKIATLPNSQQLQMTTMDVDIQLFYVDSQADTTLIFVHGAPGSLDGFSDYLSDSLLMSNYNMIAYDRPGYGKSSKSPTVSIIHQSKILLNIINKYGATTNITIGHSYGAPIAAYAATKYPNSISKSIMIAPVIDPKHEPIFWFSYFSKWPITRWLLPNGFQTAGAEKFAHSHALQEIEKSWAEDTRPIMHIHGGQDQLAPPSYNIDFVKSHIDSNLLKQHIYPDEGHLILWNNFTLTKQLILDFIKS